MALLLLVACGPSGPSAPDAPDKPGSSEPGKDPTDPGTGEPGKDPSEENTGEQKKAAVVDTLNAVRKDYGNKTQLPRSAPWLKKWQNCSWTACLACTATIR